MRIDISKIPTMTRDELEKAFIQYYKHNAEAKHKTYVNAKTKGKKKAYYDKTKEVCSCGLSISKSNMSKHLKTPNHAKLVVLKKYEKAEPVEIVEDKPAISTYTECSADEL